MPRPRDERARVLGPYWHEERKEWRIVAIHTPTAVRAKDRQSTFYYPTEDEALEAKRELEQQLCNVTLGMAIEAYEQHLRDKQTIGYQETIRRLRLFFPDLTMLVGRVTHERAKKWYDVFRARKIARLKKDGTPRKDTGRPISASYHRATLINARSMFTWIIEEKRWVRDNPFANVKGLGKRKSGKRTLTGNELRQWFDYTWSRVVAGDRTALALMMALSMSLRSSDLTRRVVRDVDMDGTQLIVTDGKSEKSNEPRIIPVMLQHYLRKLVADRDPFEPLFARKCKGKLLHMTRRWLEQGMERLCRGAEVPYVCPHSLKGAAGTVLAKRGRAANEIMDHLSHEEDATTFRHYVNRRLVEAAQAEQAFEVIARERQ